MATIQTKTTDQDWLIGLKASTLNKTSLVQTQNDSQYFLFVPLSKYSGFWLSTTEIWKLPSPTLAYVNHHENPKIHIGLLHVYLTKWIFCLLVLPKNWIILVYFLFCICAKNVIELFLVYFLHLYILSFILSCANLRFETTTLTNFGKLLCHKGSKMAWLRILTSPHLTSECEGNIIEQEPIMTLGKLKCTSNVIFESSPINRLWSSYQLYSIRWHGTVFNFIKVSPPKNESTVFLVLMLPRNIGKTENSCCLQLLIRTLH